MSDADLFPSDWPRRTRPLHLLGSLLLLRASGILCLLVTLCYALRPDTAAAVSVFPPWAWLLAGGWLAFPGWFLPRRRLAVAVTLGWLLFALVFADEPRSLLRLRPWPAPAWQEAYHRGQAMRVVVMSADDDERIAEEIVPYHPDIVLMPEPTHHRKVLRYMRRSSSKPIVCLPSSEVAIYVRGEVLTSNLVPGRRPLFIAAHVRLASGLEVGVICLSLTTPPRRADLWSLACWREHTVHRRRQREQLRAVVEHIASLPLHLPLIVGGDFNAPPGDPIFRLLKPRLRDAFQEGGIGWGNTIFNRWPVLRIDQVWISPQLRAAAVVARAVAPRLDHRLVVADLVLSK